MIALVFAVIAYCRAFFIGRHRLAMEVAALRHQLVVFKRKQPRPRLCSCDRAFWVALRGLWPGWVNALIMVKPDTVVSWHRAGFSPILATAILFSTPRPAEGQPGGSAADSAHEVGQPILGRASHPRRTATTRIRCFGTHCVALFATTPAPARQRQGAGRGK
jgi:hypothetical protein